jgi:hypothetical protein
MSGPEKRSFKLGCRKQSGNKDYLDLFNLIDKDGVTDPHALAAAFQRMHPNAFPDNTGRYLMKIILDGLILAKTEKDHFFESLQGIMRAQILSERALEEEAQKQLKKIRKEPATLQQYLIMYLSQRYELNHLSDNNFQKISDKSLIEMQMKAKEVLKRLYHIQDHYSLFEVLKHRLVHSGMIASEEEKERLNDLMLSEMILIADKSRKSFTSQKLHLLFQSFFFTHAGDHRSALKTFYELNGLFERNLHLLNHPPMDYLSTINGILDSMHSLGKYEDMAFYINKAKELDQSCYPEFFRYLARKTAAIHQLAALTASGAYKEAVLLIRSFEPDLLTAYSMVDEEKQWELYFYCSLAYFGVKDLKKAHRYIREITTEGKLQPQLLVCKATRLLNIIIHMELDDKEYLEYEVRTYRRAFKQPHHSLLRSEQFILKVVLKWCQRNVSMKRLLLDKNFAGVIETLKNDRYEKQLLRYFNFLDWLGNRRP